MNLQPFYARAATTDIPDAEKLVEGVIKAHFFARKEGLLPLQLCAGDYPSELSFFFTKLDLPFATMDEIARIKLSQVSRYPAALTRHLVAYRAAKSITRGQEDIFNLLAVLKVILGKDEIDLDLDPENIVELDAMLWRGTEVLHFSDLIKLSDRFLQMMLREVEWSETGLAFSRTSSELRDRILSQCSSSARSDLRLRMFLGGAEDKCRVAQEVWLEKLGRMINAGEVEI